LSPSKPSRRGRNGGPPWRTSPERAELLAIYAEADALLAGWSCTCSAGAASGEALCCHFAVTGREPYPTPVELREVFYAMGQASITSRHPRRLPLAEARPCPLLSGDGRCRVYASRPFGCRTFFCEQAEAPFSGCSKPPRHALNALGRRLADLSVRHDPRDSRPRPLVHALLERRG
jgi:hypothetical protein